ncbi:MAG: DUF4199 domain-containing protein [Chitinophagaceae bacterium]|nr:MAG: DUF4199 domain-containing protein [Chitinophagaceae bacterium]
MNKSSATIIGVIAGILMVIAGVVLYKTNVPEKSALNFIGFGILGLAIVIAINNYVKDASNAISFGKLFNQGFKVFVVITLLMAIYSFFFYKLQPQLVNEMTVKIKADFIATNKDRTPAEIDKMAEDYKKQLPVISVYNTVFQYLLIGTIVTFVVSGTQILKRKI